MKNALDSGVDLVNPEVYVDIDLEDLNKMLEGEDGVPIPMLEYRLECLHQVS